MSRLTLQFRTILDFRLARSLVPWALLGLLVGCGPAESPPQDASDAATGVAATLTPASGITATDARARVTLPGRTMTAGYVNLTNGGARDRRLVDATSPRMGRIELHTHERDGDLMRMVRVPYIELPAGGRAALEPGHDHLMMFEVEPPLRLGERFPVTLVFADGGREDVTFVVVPVGG